MDIYEKEYKETFERAKECYTDGLTLHQPVKDVIEYIFPELKESDDERIRREMISYFKQINYDNAHTWNGINLNKFVSWLEKQGEPVEINPTEFDTRLQTLIGKFDSLPKEELIGSLSFWMNAVQNDGTYKADKKQCEQKSKNRYTFKSIPHLLDMIEPTDRAKSYCQKLIDSLLQEGYTTDAKIVSNCLKQMNGEKVAMATMDKSADKAEPMFKIDDWVIGWATDGEPRQIAEITEEGYRTTYGGWIGFSFEEDMHLWTIQDAKDGDILSYVTDEEDLWIMIYWSLYEPYEGHVHYHALLVNDKFSDKGTCCISIDNLKPATQEQRAILFQKMHEAGYEWDAEKKELKKIYQEPASYITDE